MITVVIPDPCLPGLGIPRAGSLSLNKTSLGSLLSAAVKNAEAQLGSVLVADQRAMTYELNVLKANLSALVAAAKALSAAATKPAIPSIQTAAVKAILGSLKDQVTGQIKQTVASEVSAILNQVTSLAIGELQRDLSPVFNALNAVNALVGTAEAELVLASAVFSSQGCLAKAELLAEVFFKLKR